MDNTSNQYKNFAAAAEKANKPLMEISMDLTAKERVLSLLRKEKIDRIPCFSGMGNVTVEGMKRHNISFSKAHRNAKLMAILAASTYKIFNFESAVAPFDLCVEAEALGCEVNFYDHITDRIVYPTMKLKKFKVGDDINFDNIGDKGRVPLIIETIELLKQDVGNEVAIGSYVLGPFTLAGQITELSDLLKISFKQPEKVNNMLQKLADVIIAIAKELKRAGANYLTVREMGAPTDVISPRMFKSLVQPHLIKVAKNLESPKILHMCGNTNPIVKLMYECGFDAISVEQRNDIAMTRKKLGKDAIILGNIDAYNVLVKGKPENVKNAVIKAIREGVSGIMPSCDIWPEVPPENMKALVEATKEYGRIS